MCSNQASKGLGKGYDMLQDDIAELECRVCRLGAEPDKPLFAPCSCAGSIMYCHQDCLEQWLEHSKKDQCELCGQRIEFVPLYAAGAPSIVPLHVLLFSGVRKLFKHVLPLLGRLVLSVVLWLCIVPVCTCRLYRMWIRNNWVSAKGALGQRDTAQPFTMQLVWDDCQAGVLIAAVILLSFLSLMSFADFLRYHWEREEVLHEDRDQDVVAADAPQDEATNPETVEVREETEEIIEKNNVPTEDDCNDYDSKEADSDAETSLKPLRRCEPLTRSLDVLECHERGLNLTLEEVESESESKTLSADEVMSPRPTTSKFDRMNWTPPTPPKPRRLNDDFANDAEDFNELLVENQQIGLGDALRVELERLRELPNQAQDDGAPAINEGVDPIENELDDVRHADIEIHIALDELLGLRGPLRTLLRNILWLLAFNGAYMGLFVFIPYSIGFKVFQTFTKIPWNELFALFPFLWSHNVLKFFAELSAVSEKLNHSLQLTDIALVFLGYVEVSIMLLLLTWMVTKVQVHVHAFIPTSRPAQVLTKVGNMLKDAVTIAKVGNLLFLRIILLPMGVGLLLLLQISPILNLSTSDWASFTASNMIGVFVLLWVVGISYMLLVTVSVLQLREMLHPSFLARFIRPKEPHTDLLTSLIRETGVAHMKRFVTTIFIYVSILLLVVYLPVKAMMYLCPKLLPLKFHFCFIVPQLQVPVELTLFYLAFLTLLDAYKNSIGRALYGWLKFSSKTLGLSRYLLPHPLVRRDSQVTPLLDQAGRRRVRVIPHNEPIRPEMIVGPPLVRPPHGWDNPDFIRVNLWAYGRQAPCTVERNLAPIVTPPLCQLRCALLVLSTWFLIVVCLACSALPLCVGRAALTLFHIPSHYLHDPLCLFVGVLVLDMMKVSATRTYEYMCRAREVFHEVVASVPRVVLRNMLNAGLRLLLLVAVDILITGLMFRMLMFQFGLGSDAKARSEDKPTDGHTSAGMVLRLLLTLAQDMLVGLVILLNALLSILYGWLDKVSVRLGLIRQGEKLSISIDIHNAADRIRTVINDRQWAELAQAIRESTNTFVYPLTVDLIQIAVLGFALALGSLVAGTQTRTCLYSYFDAVGQRLGSRVDTGLGLESLCCPWDVITLESAERLRSAVRTWMLMCLSLLLHQPVLVVLHRIYQNIRDDAYLVGRRLRNSDKGEKHMSEVHTTVEEQMAFLTHTQNTQTHTQAH